jgi:RimJ/RimL family protein N-acetyltransferase
MTRRLRLEPIGPEHAQDVWLLYQDPAVVQWVAGPWTPEQAEAFAVGWRRRWEQESVGKWMAYLHDGTLVGRGGLSRMPPGERSTTQIQRLVDPRWHADRLEIASRRVMQRIGMTYAGEILWRGLVEGRTEEQDDAPFAVYVTDLANP